MHALDFDQPPRLLGRLGRIESRVAHDQDHVVAEYAAGVVEMLDRQFDARLDGGSELRQGTGEVGQEADLEWFVSDRRGGLFLLLLLLPGGRSGRRALLFFVLLFGNRLLLLLLVGLVVATGGEEAECQRSQQSQTKNVRQCSIHGSPTFIAPIDRAYVCIRKVIDQVWESSQAAGFGKPGRFAKCIQRDVALRPEISRRRRSVPRCRTARIGADCSGSTRTRTPGCRPPRTARTR